MNFTFFGAAPAQDEQSFAFALEPAQHQALASHAARLRTALKPMDPGADVSEVRVEFRAWIEGP